MQSNKANKSLFQTILQKKPDWALGEKEGKSKSTSEAPAEAAEVSSSS